MKKKLQIWKESNDVHIRVFGKKKEWRHDIIIYNFCYKKVPRKLHKEENNQESYTAMKLKPQ